MRSDWTDQLSTREAVEVWRRTVDQEVARRMATSERDLRQTVEEQRAMPAGFYEAMGHFLTLREKMFPSFPADPAWKILVTLAQTREDSGKNSVTGIAYGAGIPLTTALRYIAALEVEGIVARVPHPEDKRQVTIRLTAEGRHRLDAIADKWTSRAFLLVGVPVAALFMLLGA